MKTLYLDFDGTVVNSIKRMAEIYNTNYPEKTPLNHEEIFTWSAGIQDPKDVEDIFCDKNFHTQDLDVFEDCFETLMYLRRKGWKIVLYTKGMIMNIGHKAMWIDENMSHLIDGWIFVGTNDLQMGKNQYDMSPQNEGDITVILDDHIKNLTNSGCTYEICAKMRGDGEEWNRDWHGYYINRWIDLEENIRVIDILEYNDKH